LKDRLVQLYESFGTRDAVEIGILAVAIYLVLRFLGKTRGAGLVRGLGLIVLGLFLLAQVVIASFDLTVLGRVLDYLLTTTLVGLLVIFQPELRRGLMVLGRYSILRYLVHDREETVADRLADAAEVMSRECIGALIAIEREVALAAYAETGQRIDSEVSATLLRAIFAKRSPLHDGAVVLVDGRVAAAACQLPLGHPPPSTGPKMGMRHRAALAMSEETDALLLVVSEETGRVSLGISGRLEPVSREELAERLSSLLRQRSLNAARRTGRSRNRSAA
jgi:diadenylate cyclase